MKLLITCEHGGNAVPVQYRSLFRNRRAVLASHRGWDPGALTLARDFAAAFDAAHVYATTSRLVVELNRSPGHPQLFSEMTRGLSPAERRRLVERHYLPYRERVEAQVRKALARDARVLHLSCHSFTPRLHGEVRRADIGLLYDPRRRAEARFCSAWQKVLGSAAPDLVVRRNYPYRGDADGLTTALRKRYPDPAYAGIEIEVNQKYPLGDARAWRALRKVLIATFENACRMAVRPASAR